MSDYKRGLFKAMEQVQERTETLAKVADAGARLEVAQAAANLERVELRKLAQEAVGKGASVSEIAEAAGLSRPTIYKLLDPPKYKLKRAQQRARS